MRFEPSFARKPKDKKFKRHPFAFFRQCVQNRVDWSPVRVARDHALVVAAYLARLSPEKLASLKKAFTEDAMAPGQAADAIGVTYGTAKRWYDKWADEIKRSLESRLLPSLEESVKRVGNKRRTTSKK